MNEFIIDLGVYCRFVSDFMEEEFCMLDNLGVFFLLRKLIGDYYEFLESEAVIIRFEDEGKCFDMNMCVDKWEFYKLLLFVLE